MDKHQQRLIKGVRNKQILSRVGTGLNGSKDLYSGSCAEDLTVAQCNALGKSPGTMHRADSYSETNTTLVLSEEVAKCDAMVLPADKLTAQTDPVMKEYLRKWVQQCASPKNGTWDTGW